jgi:D-beta-D-heptose 7-phosphate kinase/D-beta-D-heptose 1-phosphate adenosyltransferase
MAVISEAVESSHKYVENYATLMMIVTAYRALNHKIVATIGSFDLLHIGHMRYLRMARTFGGILIVGVDTDEGIKRYKGPLRPVVPFNERIEMLTYQEGVTLVTGVPDVDEHGKWQYGLIKAIRPDVFVAVQGSYPNQQIREIKRYCDKVVMLPRQAEKTSTSLYIEKTIKGHLSALEELKNNGEN